MKKFILFISLLITMVNMAYSIDLSLLDDVSRGIFEKGFFLGWQMRKREHLCGSYIIPSGWRVYMDSSSLESYKMGYYKFLAMRNGLTPLAGIGDVVFGVFDNEEDALKAKDMLQKSGVKGIIWVEYKKSEAIVNPCVNFSLKYATTHLDKTLYYMEFALKEARSIANPSVNKKALIHDITTVINGLQAIGAKVRNENSYYQSESIKVPPSYQNLIERSKLWAK